MTFDADEFTNDGAKIEYSQEDGMHMYGASGEKHIGLKHALDMTNIEISYTYVKLGNHTGSEAITNRFGYAPDVVGAYDWAAWSTRDLLWYTKNLRSVKNYYPPQPGGRLKFAVQSKAIKFFYDDNQIFSWTLSNVPTYFGFYPNTGRDWYIRDLIIKEL